jgi:hypothetical protein
MHHSSQQLRLTRDRPTDSTHMNKIVLLLLVGTGALLAFFGYCAVLVDWIQSFSGDTYKQNYWEALLETAGLLLYTYLGIRFFNRNLGSFR